MAEGAISESRFQNARLSAFSEGESVYVVASFKQAMFLELAVTALEQAGIRQDHILAVPLDKRMENRKLFDTIHRADGNSLFDVPAVLGSVGMLLGTIYGYVLEWGPILWGLIGLVAGAFLGFGGKLLFVRWKTGAWVRRDDSAEVFLMVHCSPEQTQMVESVLRDNTALGLGKVEHA